MRVWTELGPQGRTDIRGGWRWRVRPLLVAVACALVACGGEVGADVSPAVRDSAGVTVVELSAAPLLAAGGLRAQEPPETWRLSPEPVLEAGGPGTPADELFTRIAGAARLEDGRYVVADGGELRLSVYGPDGALDETIGSEGAGPGEFRHIWGLWTAGDTIGVWDPRLRRLTWFLPDGEVVGTARPESGDVQVPVGAGSLEMFLGPFEDGRIGLAWLSTVWGPGERPPEDRLVPDRMVFGVFDATGQLRKVLGHATGMVRSFGPHGGGPIAFSPFSWAAVVRDSLVYTNGLQGEVLIYDPAAPDSGVARRLTVEGSEIGLDEARDAVEEALAEASERARSMASLFRMDVTAGRVPAHGRMLADDEGRLWLKAYDPTTDPLVLGGGRFRTGGEWTIVETDGTVVAHLDMPDHVAPVAVVGDELLGVARDELDVERFVVHRILR